MRCWETELDSYLPRIVELRRHLHQHPELSGQENETKALVISVLEELGIEIHTFQDCCGVMGVLKNGEGRCIAIRADMDALPVTEETGLDFASDTPGVMHACGHDAHVALALGSAMWLANHREQWKGTIKWLFEPAEETYGGARLMVEQGCMKNPRVDAVFGQHMNPRYEAGTFFAKPGYVSGSSSRVELIIRGHSCHGAYPESGTDAIVIAAQVVTALQTLVSRNISPFDPVVLTMGTIQGGTANNIVCDEVRLTGTMRTLSDETKLKMYDKIHTLVKGITQSMGGDAEVSIEQGYGSVYNDDTLYEVIEGLAESILGKEKIVRRDMPSLGVESFCYFLENTPGVYYDLGSGIGTALHTPTFCVDESCLLPGVALQCASVLAILKEE